MKKSQHVKLVAQGCFAVIIAPLIYFQLYLFSRKEYRYMKMNGWVNKAMRTGNPETAATLATEWLELAQKSRGWNYGNAIHDSHQAIGYAHLRRGEVEEAKKHLLLAGRTPGSPQLNSFGPRMLLARELLLCGETAIVLKYLDLVAKFWANDKRKKDPEFKQLARTKKIQLQTWKAEIEAGHVPNHKMWT